MNLSKFWDLLKNETIQKWLLILSLIICIFFLLKTCSTKNDEINRAINNIEAYKDTTHTIELKNGQIEYERQLLIVKVDELTKYSESLKRELDKEKKNIKVIWKERIKIVDSIIYVDSSSYKRINDSSYIIDWEFNNFAQTTSWIKGHSIFTLDSSRNIHNLLSNMYNFGLCIDVVTGIREIEKDKYVTFVRTKDKNSAISFEEIEGAIVDPSLFKTTEDWLILGPQIGAGYSDHLIFYVGLGVTVKLLGTHF